MSESRRDIIRRLAGDIVERRIQAEAGGEPPPGPPPGLDDELRAAGFAGGAGGTGPGQEPAAAESFHAVAERLCVDAAGGDLDSAVDQFVNLAAACLEAPLPAAAMVNLHRYLERSGGPAVFLDTIGRAAPLVEMLVTIFGSSQYMADILIRNPGYVYWLMDARTWDEPDTADFFAESLRSAAGAFRTVEGRLGAIRRAHRRALLKIGARDLLGEAPVEETATKLSNLADAVSQVVLEVVASDLAAGGQPAAHGPGDGGGFAVIALGKLGGRELNYSSDIDVMFVSADAGDEAMAFYVKLARAFTTALTEVTPEGYLYRVDLRLRPDGQAGPLVNPETAIRVYYENRGRPWEFQALLKARAIAGDADLGRRFLDTVSALVYNPSLPYTPLEDIARMRAQIAESIPARDRSFNIKLMSGGIRDIEFTAQTLQLMHGSTQEELRTPNTLEALDRIGRLGLLEDWQVENLCAAYRFFRLVEHRLQMMHQLKTHSVPDSPGEIALLARRAGKGPLGKFTTDSFRETLSRHLNNVRTFSDSFFAGEDVHPHSVLLLLPEDDERAAAIISQYGVTDVRQAMRLLHTMAYGSFPRLLDRATRAAFEELMPLLLEGVAETGAPEKTLVNVARLAEASRNETALYRLMTASAPARRRLIALAGFSSYLTQRLCNQMEYFDHFVDSPEPRVESFDRVADWEGAWALPRDPGAFDDRSSVERRDRHRRWLDRARIAGFVADHVEGGIAARSPAVLTGAVREMVASAFERTIGPGRPVALFALGSFAVGEPRMFSDLDVIVVAGDVDIPSLTLEVQAINRWFDEGGIVKLDFRLRGEGASAPLVQDLDFYRRYFSGRMSLWERVAFAKCSFWWGDQALAGEFTEALRSAVARPFEPEEVATLVKSRRSIETLAPKMMPDWETKRSAGGRYDIEYLTAVGLAEATPGREYEFSLDTRARLAALGHRGLLDEEEVDAISSALTAFTAAEYLLELQELTLPRSRERADEIERYLSKSFAYWGLAHEGGVAASLSRAKQSVRACFERFMAKRAS